MTHVVNAAKCKKCGKLSYPTHFYCPECGGNEFDAVAIGGEGTLLTFTRAYALALDFDERFVTIGIVQMDQGIRATGRIDIDEPATGMRVRATVGPVRDVDGRDVYGLRFVSAANGAANEAAAESAAR